MSEPTSTDTTTSSPTRRERLGLDITYGMGLMRGLSALGIAVLLFIVPDKSTSMLANKMGFFWLFSGIALVRRNRNDPALQNMGKRTTTAIAVVGIFTGLLMVTRRLTEQFVPEATLVTLLGVVIMLTGLLHLWSEWSVGGTFSRGHRVLHALLGVFEVILGLMLVISPLDRSQATYWIATVWALVFGILAIGETVAQWLEARKTAKETSPEETSAEDDAAASTT